MNDSIGSRPQKVTDLLSQDITQPGWSINVASSKVFFVRGVTWLRENLLRQSNSINPYVTALPSYLKDYEDFLGGDFDWAQRFSTRQAGNAISLNRRKALRFDKAVLTILSCDLYARNIFDEDRQPSTVFGNMFVEPSVFYIRDFDKAAMNEMLESKPDMLEILRDGTDQTSRKVFEQMASGMNVTKELADKTLEIIRKEIPASTVGDVDWRPRDGSRGPADAQVIV